MMQMESHNRVTGIRKRTGTGGRGTNHEEDQQHHEDQQQASSSSSTSPAATHRGHDEMIVSKSNNNRSLGMAFYLFLHFAAMICLVLGLVWRSQLLHNGSECQMTYSKRVFFELSLAMMQQKTKGNEMISKEYKLYKFVDQRDPRYQTMLQERNDDTPQQLQLDPRNHRQTWCGGSTTTVLFIPGHWGSYEQSRSIGAHGVQLTGARMSSAQTRHVQELLLQQQQQQQQHGHDSSLADFFFDVYAVDFAEQGAALHGEFLVAQSEFVAQAIHFLVDACAADSSNNNIILVAHSMGGIVAHLSLQKDPQLAAIVQDVILLASPIAGPLYGFDSSIWDTYQQLKQPRHKNDMLTVSIAGGLRDEMIQPEACRVEGDNIVAILSTDSLGDTTGQRLGMDHRAIVWCHGVLAAVRQVIWAVTVHRNKATEERKRHIQDILNKDSYSDNHKFDRSLADMYDHFTSIFGSVKSTAMTAAVIYNLPFILAHYAIIACIHIAHSPTKIISQSMIHAIAPGLSILMGFLSSDLSFAPTVIQALVANTVYLVLEFGFGLLQEPRSASGGLSTRFVVKRVLVLSCGIAPILVVTISTRLFRQRRPVLSVDVVAFVAVILVIYQLLAWMVNCNSGFHSNTTSAMAIFAMVVVPFSFVGSISLIFWEQSTRWSSWASLLQIVVPLLGGCFSRLHVCQEISYYWKHSPRIIITIALIAFNAPLLFQRGTFFRTGNLLSYMLWADLVLK